MKVTQWPVFMYMHTCNTPAGKFLETVGFSAKCMASYRLIHTCIYTHVCTHTHTYLNIMCSLFVPSCLDAQLYIMYIHVHGIETCIGSVQANENLQYRGFCPATIQYDPWHLASTYIHTCIHVHRNTPVYTVHEQVHKKTVSFKWKAWSIVTLTIHMLVYTCIYTCTWIYLVHNIHHGIWILPLLCV